MFEMIKEITSKKKDAHQLRKHEEESTSYPEATPKIETRLQVGLGMRDRKHNDKHKREEDTTKLTQVRILKMALQNDGKIGIRWKRNHCFY